MYISIFNVHFSSETEIVLVNQATFWNNKKSGSRKIEDKQFYFFKNWAQRSSHVRNQEIKNAFIHYW